MRSFKHAYCKINSVYIRRKMSVVVTANRTASHHHDGKTCRGCKRDFIKKKSSSSSSNPIVKSQFYAQVHSHKKIVS